MAKYSKQERLKIGREIYESGMTFIEAGMSHLYCCGVMLLSSASLIGQWKAPCSNLLYSRRNPLPSQYSAFILSRLLPQNKNSALVYGSSSNWYFTMPARPSMLLRRSV